MLQSILFKMFYSLSSIELCNANKINIILFKTTFNIAITGCY